MNEVAQVFSLRRVAAMVLRYWYLLRSSFARLIELIYWPAVQMLMWGFLQTYLAGQASLYACAGGVLCQSDGDRLGGRHLRLGAGAQERTGCRNVCLEHHVPVPAAHLRLLPGGSAAPLVADRCLVTAPHIRVRRDARVADRPHVP